MCVCGGGGVVSKISFMHDAAVGLAEALFVQQTCSDKRYCRVMSRYCLLQRYSTHLSPWKEAQEEDSQPRDVLLCAFIHSASFFVMTSTMEKPLLRQQWSLWLQDEWREKETGTGIWSLCYIEERRWEMFSPSSFVFHHYINHPFCRLSVLVVK